MSMHSFYTHETAFSHILTLTHFGDLQHHSYSFNISTSSNSEMSCTHPHHLRMFYHVSMHHTSTHLRIFDNHPRMHYMLPEPSHLHRHTSLHIPSYSRYIISHIWTSSCTKAHIRRISGIIHTRHEYSQCLRKHLDTDSVNSTALLTHWFASPNISIAQGHASRLSPVSILPHQFGIFRLFFKF